MTQNEPKQIHLRWQMIPAYIYEGLSAKKGSEAYYNPFFGPGVYLFILAGSADRTLFEIGMSASETGNRLAYHHKGWFGLESDYYLPNDPKLALQNIYDPKIKWGQPSNRTEEINQQIGTFLTRTTYFLIASLHGESKQTLERVEAILQHSFIKHRELSQEWYRRIGCTHLDLSNIAESYNLISHYSNAEIGSFVSPNLPQNIVFSGGTIQ